MRLLSKEDFKKFKKNLHENEIKYDFELSGSTSTIYSPIGDRRCLQAKIPPKQLGFINRIKNHIKRVLKENKNFWEGKNVVNGKRFIIKYKEDGKTDIAYSRWAKNLEVGKEFNDIYEVDIRSAYWTVANSWGLLSPELFLEGKRRKKKLRLIGLGSLATKKYKLKYIPSKKKQILKKIVVNTKTKKVWDNICGVVGNSILNVMRSLPSHDFIFFWVDGIYFKGEKNIEKVLGLFKKHGFNCKVKKIYKIKVEVDKEFNTNANIIRVYETQKQYENRNKKKSKDKGRPFFVSKKAFK